MYAHKKKIGCFNASRKKKQVSRRCRKKEEKSFFAVANENDTIIVLFAQRERESLSLLKP